MAWKTLSAFHAIGRPAATAYPGHISATGVHGGAYRIRVTHGEDPVALGNYCAALVAYGRMPLVYIETGYTLSPDTWKSRMQGFANALGKDGAGCTWLEFGNEINRGSPGSSQNDPYNTYQELWDAYLERARISSTIFRDAGMGFICTCIGPTVHTAEWFRFIRDRGKWHLFDAAATHCYSGGDHMPPLGSPVGTIGPPAGGMPIDTQIKLEDSRAALDAAGQNNMGLWTTEVGWPTGPYARDATKTGCDTTNGSKTVSGIGSTADLLVGYWATGSGIPADTEIESIVNSTTITLTNAATATASVTLGFGGGSIDPGHQTYCSDAEQATRLTDMFTRVFNVSAATRNRLTAWFASTDYRSAWQTPGVGNTPGNWANFQGVRFEAGTPRAAANPPSGHKPSWDAFDTDAGIGRGNLGIEPTVTAPAVTGITATAATMEATIHPHSLDVSYRAEWGLDAGPGLEANYGNRGPIAVLPAGGSAVAVERPLPSLNPGNTYHARIFCWSDAGESWSTRVPFVATPPPPPAGSGLWPSDALWPSNALWPSGTGFVPPDPDPDPDPPPPPSWSGPRRFTPKAGTAGTIASRGYHPNVYTLDIGEVIADGGLTTADPFVKGALRDSGFFDESDP